MGNKIYDHRYKLLNNLGKQLYSYYTRLIISC